MKFIRKPEQIGTLSSGACIVLSGGGGCIVCYDPAPGYVPGPYKNSAPIKIGEIDNKNDK